MSKTSVPIPSPLYVACQALISSEPGWTTAGLVSVIRLRSVLSGALWMAPFGTACKSVASVDAASQNPRTEAVGLGRHGGQGTNLASGKQEVIPAFLEMGIQVSSPAMPNVVTSVCWLAGASRPVDSQASQGAHQRPKGPPHHLYRHPANRPSLPAGGTQGSYGS